MVVGEVDLEVEVLFDQYPCKYTEKYSFNIYNSAGTLIANPSSIFEQYYEYFLVGVPSNSDIGNFQIEICHTLVEPNLKKCVRFKLAIKPCWVTKLYFKSVASFIYYRMGDAPITSAAKYQLVQEPSYCKHPVVVDASALNTPYVVHNAATNDFSVPQVLVANSGYTATVTIKAKIDCVANNACSGAELKASNTFQIDIEIENPCDTTVFNPIPDIIVNIKSSPMSKAIGPPKDDVSLNSGNKDGTTFCGARSLTIKDSPSGISWWTYSASTFTFTVNTGASTLTEGTYSFTANAVLAKYPAANKILPFKVIISSGSVACVPKDHKAWDTPADQVMVVGEVDLEVQVSFDQYPCTYTEKYSFNIYNSAGTLIANPSSIFEQYFEYFLVGVPKQSDIGDYGIEICHLLVEAKLTKCASFKLKIKPCWVTKLSFKKASNFIFYSMGDAPLANVAKYEFVTEPAFCQPPVQVDASALTTPFIIHNAATSDFSVPRIVMAKNPTYTATVIIKAKIDCVTQNACSGSELKASNDYQLEIAIENPCENTLFGSISDIVLTIGSGSVQTILGPPKDDVSLNSGNKDGTTFCGARSLTIKDSPSGISWWTYSASTFTFTVDTDPSSITEGTYSFTADVVLTNFAATTHKVPFKVVVLKPANVCTIDELTLMKTVDSFTYYIAKTGRRVITLPVKQSRPQCPLVVELKSKVNGNVQPLSAALANAIQLSQDLASVIVDTSDFGLDQKRVDLVVNVTSVTSKFSKRTVSLAWSVLFWDECWDAQLKAPSVAQPTFTFSLWESQSMSMVQMEDLTNGPTKCGGYSHRIEYLDGPMLSKKDDFAQIYQLVKINQQNFTYTGTPKSKDVIGRHQLRFWGVNGVNKVYKAVYADFTLIVQDPCANSVVNGDKKFTVRDMILADGVGQASQVYAGPTDSTSVKYGNGYDMCGFRTYALLNGQGTAMKSKEVRLNVKNSVAGADEVSIAVDTLPSGREYKIDVQLRVGLADYPNATPLILPFKATQRICQPTNFRAYGIVDQVIHVGDDAFDIKVEFDQSPCTYSLEYSFRILDSQDNETMASFITVVQNQVIVSPPKSKHIGSYKVEVCSSFIDERKCQVFKITVEKAIEQQATVEETAKDTTEVVDEVPIVDIVTKTQRVQLGTNLDYIPGIPDRVKGYSMSVELVLGKATKFSAYSKTTNTFRVLGKLLQNRDVGEYPIQVRLTLTKGSITRVFSETFNLIVWGYIPGKNSDKELTGRIIDPRKQATFLRKQELLQAELERLRPLPHIVEFRPDGTLVIGWDSLMAPPANITRLPATMVAIEADSSLNDLRYRQTRRNLRAYDDFEILFEETPELVNFINETDMSISKMWLLESLEIRVTPDDADRLPQLAFNWTVLDYTERSLTLKLSFEHQDQVSKDDAPDTLSVAFWGADFFKNRNEIAVKQGTTLYQPITRLYTSSSEQSYADKATEAFGVLSAVCLICVLPFMATSALLPAWVFIHSAQLISHLVLLNTTMPANAHTFLRHINDLLRWYDASTYFSIAESFHLSRSEVGTGAYSAYFLLAGYSMPFLQNLVLIVIVLAALLISWTALTVKDFIVRPKKAHQVSQHWRKQHSAWCQNFVIRFVYLFCLELWICAFLQLSIDHAEAEQMSSLQYAFAIIALAVLTCLLAFTISLCFRKGAWVPRFYTKWTVMGSLYQIRARDPSFQLDKFKKENPKGAIRTPFLSMLLSVCRMIKDRWSKSDQMGPKKTTVVPQNEVVITPIIVASQTDEICMNSSRGFISSQLTRREDKSESPKRCTTALEIQGTGDQPSEPDQGLCQDLFQEANIQLREGGEEVEDIPPLSGRAAAQPQKSLSRHESVLHLPRHDSLESEVILEESQEESLTTLSAIYEEAKLRVSVSRRVKEHARFKTLHYGLKKNHERNVAIGHPLLFMLRRIFYAAIVVYMGAPPAIPVFLIMILCLSTLAYSICEREWQSMAINWQHICNEAVTYLVVVLQLSFNGYVPDSAIRSGVGWLLISICLAYMAFNFVVILYHVLCQARAYLRRIVMIMRRSGLRSEAQRLTKKLSQLIAFVPEPGQDENGTFCDVEVDHRRWSERQKRRFLAFDSIGGGFGAAIYVGDIIEHWGEQQLLGADCPHGKQHTGGSGCPNQTEDSRKIPLCRKNSGQAPDLIKETAPQASFELPEAKVIKKASPTHKSKKKKKRTKTNTDASQNYTIEGMSTSMLIIGYNAPVEMEQPTENGPITDNIVETLEEMSAKQFVAKQDHRYQQERAKTDSQASFDATQSMMQEKTMFVEVQRTLGASLARDLIQRQSEHGLNGLVFTQGSMNSNSAASDAKEDDSASSVKERNKRNPDSRRPDLTRAFSIEDQVSSVPKKQLTTGQNKKPPKNIFKAQKEAPDKALKAQHQATKWVKWETTIRNRKGLDRIHQSSREKTAKSDRQTSFYTGTLEEIASISNRQSSEVDSQDGRNLFRVNNDKQLALSRMDRSSQNDSEQCQDLESKPQPWKRTLKNTLQSSEKGIEARCTAIDAVREDYDESKRDNEKFQPAKVRKVNQLAKVDVIQNVIEKLSPSAQRKLVAQFSYENRDVSTMPSNDVSDSLPHPEVWKENRGAAEHMDSLLGSSLSKKPSVSYRPYMISPMALNGVSPPHRLVNVFSSPHRAIGVAVQDGSSLNDSRSLSSKSRGERLAELARVLSNRSNSNASSVISADRSAKGHSPDLHLAHGGVTPRQQTNTNQNLVKYRETDNQRVAGRQLRLAGNAVVSNNNQQFATVKKQLAYLQDRKSSNTEILDTYASMEKSLEEH